MGKATELDEYVMWIVSLFRISKTMFCAYDRKHTNYDNDGCNDNYDGNVDDNYDIKWPNKHTNIKSFG